ncbi:MAG: alpha/beta hydrolase [Candidatus Saccharimonadales bacterium]
MAKTKDKSAKRVPKDFIKPLNMNGLKGRMMYLPAPKNKKREILFVYGHHSSLERWWGLVQDLNQYGAVTMPDLPGFGGMQSFYRIGKIPDIDTMADYMASFIKLRYKRKTVTIIGLSYGFVIATRMIQRYPDLAKKVNLIISVVGFAHHDDFVFKKSRYNIYVAASRFFSFRLPALFFRNVLLHPSVLRLAYAHTHNAKSKFEGLPKAKQRENMDFEIHLWHSNDLRTHMYTSYDFLRVDNCKKPIDMPLWHIAVPADQYFDAESVEQHLKLIYNKVNIAVADVDNHAPSIIAEAEEAAPLIPTKIRRLLARQP